MYVTYTLSCVCDKFVIKLSIMNAVVIYGPPGSGKLTISKELSRITKYKLIDNHLSIDFASKFYQLWSPKFWIFLDKLRLLIFNQLVEDGVNFISTFVYIPGVNDSMIKNYLRIIGENGNLYLVRLLPSVNELEKRIIKEDRKKHSKISDLRSFKNFSQMNDIYAIIKNKKSLDIDNSNLSALKVAKKIAKYYNLIHKNEEKP